LFLLWILEHHSISSQNITTAAALLLYMNTFDFCLTGPQKKTFDKCRSRTSHIIAFYNGKKIRTKSIKTRLNLRN